MSGFVSYLEVEDGYEGQRLDNFLFARYRKVPKSHIYKALRKGEFRVNKKRVKPDYRVNAGDIVRVPPIFTAEQNGESPLAPSERWMDLIRKSVVYEDNLIIAINKPSGIAVHGGSGLDYGVIEVMRKLYPESPNIELVHRLDRDTSGILLLAKKRSGLRMLHEVFRAGKIQKSYLALTKGSWLKKERRVDVALRKFQLTSGERRVVVDRSGGKESLSVFERKKVYPGAELVLARLMTGRTHQLRVHSQYVNHPIAGDEKYGDAEFNATMKRFGLKRLFLHAHRVKMELPGYDAPLIIEVPLDEVLSQVLCNMEMPAS